MSLETFTKPPNPGRANCLQLRTVLPRHKRCQHPFLGQSSLQMPRCASPTTKIPQNYKNPTLISPVHSRRSVHYVAPRSHPLEDEREGGVRQLSLRRGSNWHSSATHTYPLAPLCQRCLLPSKAVCALVFRAYCHAQPRLSRYTEHPLASLLSPSSPNPPYHWPMLHTTHASSSPLRPPVPSVACPSVPIARCLRRRRGALCAHLRS